MSFDKAIKHKKTRRKQYHGAKLVDPSCRNHGNCYYCTSNRLRLSKKIIAIAQDIIREAKEDLKNL